MNSEDFFRHQNVYIQFIFCNVKEKHQLMGFEPMHIRLVTVCSTTRPNARSGDSRVILAIIIFCIFFEEFPSFFILQTKSLKFLQSYFQFIFKN